MAVTGSSLRGIVDGGAVKRRPVGDDGATQTSAGMAHQMSVLREMIESQIIPRMMLAHRAGAPEVADAAAAEPPDSWQRSIARLTDLVFDADPDAAAGYVRELRVRGRGTAALLVQLLGPTARRLGEQWTADERSFTEVTLGLARLQSLLWDLSLSARDHDYRPAAPGRGRVLITASPGEQHTFGASVVAEFFRWWGWDVVAGPFSTVQALLEAVHKQRYSVIGLSLSVDRRLGGLAAQIADIRGDSANERVAVMVGGRVFADTPGLAEEVGADVFADSAEDAPELAGEIVAEREHLVSLEKCV